MRPKLQLQDAEAVYTWQDPPVLLHADGREVKIPAPGGPAMRPLAEAMTAILRHATDLPFPCTPADCTPSDRTPCTCMPCLELRFSTQTLPDAKFAELDRQLAGQQAGLNALTVAEYLEARARYHRRLRRGSVARRARLARQAILIAERVQALQEDGATQADALAAAKVDVAQRMRGMHALHAPDLIAGGRDVIADFGDGDVNTTIGRQWNRAGHRACAPVEALDAAARQIPAAARALVHMNGRLQRAVSVTTGPAQAAPCRGSTPPAAAVENDGPLSTWPDSG